MRRLHATRRQVPLDRTDEYVAAWSAVRSAVENAGARAWLFRRAGHEDQFIEFVEWTGAAGPLEDAGVAAAMAELDGFGAPAHAEEWEEFR